MRRVKRDRRKEPLWAQKAQEHWRLGPFSKVDRTKEGGRSQNGDLQATLVLDVFVLHRSFLKI